MTLQTRPHSFKEKYQARYFDGEGKTRGLDLPRFPPPHFPYTPSKFGGLDSDSLEGLGVSGKKENKTVDMWQSGGVNSKDCISHLGENFL